MDKTTLRIAILFVLFLWNPYIASEASTPSPARDTVMASMLVSSPGAMIWQAGGHAAIRLQCPAYGLDNAFSYETDNAGGTLGQLLGQARGRYVSVESREYISHFKEEGRKVKSYPLNLTDMQIRRLWQLLDECVESGCEDNFNVRFSNCNSKAIDKIIEALDSDNLIIKDNRYITDDNGTLQKSILKDESPWATLVFNVGCGTDADKTDSWRTRMVPLMMETCFSDALIESADGSVRPFLAGNGETVVAGESKKTCQALSPASLSLILLIFVVVVSLLDLSGKCRKTVRVSDIVLLVMQTAGFVALALVSIVPASIGTPWNWMYIPLNPLPLIVWVCFRGKAICARFFVFYGTVCLLFTFAPMFTSEADTWSSLISVAIAVRTLSHYINQLSKHKQ